MTERIIRIARCALVLTLFLSGDRRTGAETCSLTAAKDNTIFQELPTRSFGAGDYLFAGRAGTGSRRALVAFDLAACLTPIPAGSTITGATLTLSADRRGPSFSAETVRLFRVTQEWGEAGSDTFSGGVIGSGSAGGDGTAAQTGDATWQARFFSATTPTLWTAQGGDFAQESANKMLTNFPNGTPTPFTWSSTQMAADVQGWLNSGGNFGWIIRADEGTTRSAVRFLSRNHPQSANWPRLSIDYMPPATGLKWDLDGDDDVDKGDFRKMITDDLVAFGTRQGATEAQGDFTGPGGVRDGRVGLRDTPLFR